jgi:hypothetical protein
MTTRRPYEQADHPRQLNQPTIPPGSAASGLSEESVRELLRAVAPTPARQLTGAQRNQLRRMVGRRWQEQACCASSDPLAWYPGNGSPTYRQVMWICAACPVRRSCLAVALLWNEDGIWAGTSRVQRRDGYRLLRAGVSVLAVVQLLLAQADQLTTVPATTADVLSTVNEVPGESPHRPARTSAPAPACEAA